MEGRSFNPSLLKGRTKLRAAWEATHTNGDRVLYTLLYAFLVNTDVSGDTGRVLSQAETGWNLAKSLGGLDRADGVGVGPLGLWYAVRLKSECALLTMVLTLSELYRGVDDEKYRAVKLSLENHAVRNTELVHIGSSRFGCK